MSISSFFSGQTVNINLSAVVTYQVYYVTKEDKVQIMVLKDSLTQHFGHLSSTMMNTTSSESI
jgi:hypothetical protein